MKPALEQLHVLTELRAGIADLLRLCRGAGAETASVEPEVVQKLRLADIELDSYAFALFAGVAKQAEESSITDAADWNFALSGLAIGLENMGLSEIFTPETMAAANELKSLSASPGRPNLLRAKAAIDRARRATEAFSGAVSDVYMRRVSTLSYALNVDRRAAAVFAEAVIRTTVAFQASRIADALTRRARDELGIPPWDPLFVGTASGQVVFAESLRHAGEVCRNSDSYIVVCRTADGDEDVPAKVRGVILGHALPHLSHLGVRVRQAGVVFVCAEDPVVFNEMWSGEARSMEEATLVVDSSHGLKSLTKVKREDSCLLPADKKSGSSVPCSVRIEPADVRNASVLPLKEATMANSSAKCSFAGRLATIAGKNEGLFFAPEGICLPFGAFHEAGKPYRAELEKLIRAYDDAFNGIGGEPVAQSVACELRDLILAKFVVSSKIVSAIAGAFKGSSGAVATTVMVRSSANCEDLEDLSGAGLYDSIANVDPSDGDMVSGAVLQVWASLWTRRAASSRAAFGVPHETASMAVLVQRMVRPADVSFVAFSRNPVDTRDAGNIYVELAVGMGETLASGGVPGQPYRLRIARGDPEKVIVDSFASYSAELGPSQDGKMGLQRRTVDYSQQRLTVNAEFRSALATRIARTVLLLEQELGGGPLDTEGVVSVNPESDGVLLYVVQARPQITN